MGAESTIYITREDAVKEISARFFSMEDQKLEKICEILEVAGTLYNYQIVSEYNESESSRNFC